LVLLILTHLRNFPLAINMNYIKKPAFIEQFDLMDVKRHSRCCPACGHRFIPWATWRITTWSCLPCPKCGVRLNRRRGIQLVLINLTGVTIYILLLSAFGAVHELSLATGIALIIFAMFITWLVDALTVRLVVAGKWRGGIADMRLKGSHRG
jgi:hypothetical protein